MFGVYTCANNQMLPFLRVWLGALRANSPGVPICVLPFGETISEVKPFCDRAGIQYYGEKTEEWIRMGRQLYAAEDYRTDTPRAWYLSKMAPFTGPFETFLFIDANIIILRDIKVLEEEFTNSDYDIIFRFRASEFRNIKNTEIRDQWNKLSPGLKNGYNANFFLSRRNCMSLEKCWEMVNGDPDLRNKFGTAGVQGIMTYYIATQGLKASTIHTIYNKELGASCRSELDISADGEVRKDGSRVMFIKWNGAAIGPEMPNYDVFLKLRERFEISGI